MARHSRGTRQVTKAEKALADHVRIINMEPIKLECTKAVFDLDKKTDVTLYKAGEFVPATTTADVLSRVGNDSAKFLEIANAGLRDYTRELIAANPDVPWQAKDEEGNLVPFSGTTITEEKSLQLAANVLNMAKMVFGYHKDLSRDEKRVAKEKAQDMLLGNPAVVASLKEA